MAWRRTTPPRPCAGSVHVRVPIQPPHPNEPQPLRAVLGLDVVEVAVLLPLAVVPDEGRLLARREQARRHRAEGGRREQPAAVRRDAAREQHPRPRLHVAGGGEEPRAARLERRRRVPVQDAEVVDALDVLLEAPGLRVEPVGPAEAAALLRRNEERGVAHPERLEDLLAQEVAEAPPRRDLDHRAHDVGRVAVLPALARVEREAEAAELVREFDGGHARMVVPRELVGQARRHREQVAHHRRTRGRAALRADADVGEAGQEPLDAVLEREEPALDADRGGEAGERLRGREHPEDRVAVRGAGPREVGAAEEALVEFALAVEDERQRAGPFARVDRPSDRLVEPGLEEGGVHGRRFYSAAQPSARRKESGHSPHFRRPGAARIANDQPGIGCLRSGILVASRPVPKAFAP